MLRIICNNCYVNEAKRFTFVIGRESDPSGNGYNNITEEVDICFDCFYKMFNKMSLELKTELMKFLVPLNYENKK